MTEAERGRASPIPGEVCEKRARRESAPEGGAQGPSRGASRPRRAPRGLLQGAPEDPGGAPPFHIGFFVLAGLAGAHRAVLGLHQEDEVEADRPERLERFKNHAHQE